jgi:tetratricopeptide (TPR) repeat protein
MAKKPEPARVIQRPAPKKAAPSKWPVIAAVAAAIIAVWWAYAPAFSGPFLFDDNTLPFAKSAAAMADPMIVWITSNRPVLMFTYWVNARLSGSDTYSYHILNVIFHLITGGIVFFIVRRFLEWSRVEVQQRNLLAAFSALVFLLHPAQSEAVAYLAGRSESLSVMLAFAAFAVFIYRREPQISWITTLAVLALFMASLLTKQQTIALPGLLLLTDFWWNPGFSFKGIRDNWKLYAPMALAALAAVAFFWNVITTDATAGFAMKDFTWYQYFFTQCRALFIYLREFVLPVGLTADWDFPVSRTILDRGALFGLIALLALAAAAWHYRRRYPLVSFGFFAFLVMMSPTSSILPIRDTVAERRLYFGILGLLLIAAGLLSRVRLKRTSLTAALAVVLLIFTVATRSRAEVWSSAIALWQDTVEKSPDKSRAHFQLASAYADLNQCALAAGEFEKAAQSSLERVIRYNLLVDWGLALECAGQPDQALAKLREAAAIDPTAHVYTQICKVYGDHAQWTEALDALAMAEKLDPTFAAIYEYRGNVYLNTNRVAEAVKEYQHALALDPTLESSKQNLQLALKRLAAAR